VTGFRPWHVIREHPIAVGVVGGRLARGGGGGFGPASERGEPHEEEPAAKNRTRPRCGVTALAATTGAGVAQADGYLTATEQSYVDDSYYATCAKFDDGMTGNVRYHTAVAMGVVQAALVFESARGGGYLTLGQARYTFTKAVAAVGGIDGVRLHDLWHTCASLAISAGANVKVVQKLLGHKTAVLTLDRYGHLFPDDLEAVATAFDAAAQSTADWPRTDQPLRVAAAYKKGS
jgi:hypothetical protein